MSIDTAGLRRRVRVSRRLELARDRAERNYNAFLAVAAVVFSVSLSSILKDFLIPRGGDSESVAFAYVTVYSIALALAAAFIAFFLAMYRKRSSRAVSVASVALSFAVIAVAVALSVLDGLSGRNLAAALVGAMVVSVALTAETWVYFAIEAWFLLLFGVAYSVSAVERFDPATFARVAFIAAGSLSIGLYVGNLRELVAILSMELEERERELRDALVRDRLTGAYNRIFMDEFLTKQVRGMRRYGDTIAILLFDIDRLCRVNEELGRDRGDNALKELVSVLTEHVRDSDLVARTGGGEFAVLLPRTTLENAIAVADKLRSRVAERDFDGIPWPLTVSGGVGMLTAGDTLGSALSRVDEALSAAKKGGRDRVETVIPAPSEDGDGDAADY
jgi:diguanylate cyclase (GGDEF)-like protein